MTNTDRLWIVQKIEAEIARLGEQFASQHPELGRLDISLVGALGTGLYSGPKPKRLSHNPGCPFESVIEADLRLILPEDRHPHDEAVVAAINDVFKPEFSPVLAITYHWSRTDIPTSRFYRYDALGDDLGFEWELAVSQQPYVDIAPYWKSLFSDEEMNWQRGVRAAMYQLPIDLHEEYVPVKNLQNREARWRLVAAQALLENTAPQRPEFPRISPLGAPVGPLVRKWLAGESGYRTMERPSFELPEALRERTRRVAGLDADLLSTPPTQPAWVTFADQWQQGLKKRRPSLEVSPA